MFPCARFDDQTPGSEHSFALRGLRETVVARRLDDVIPALERVARASVDGLWAAGYVGYEAAPAFDPTLTVRMREEGDPFEHLPLVWFGLFDRRERYETFEPRATRPAPYHVSAWKPSIDRPQFTSAIRSIRDAIASGETYQLNFSLRLRAAFSGHPGEFYRDLALAQRGAYAAYFDLGRYRVVGASPELFFEVHGNRITTRPMKGTIRRGRYLAEDLELAERLLASEKDRAENLIIVDLIRNDLGRIAEFGSVEPTDVLTLERYETVWQLASGVEATMRPGTTLVDIFTALFPSGSVTGAPKPRTMQLIADLETLPRGVYCGAVGYVAPADADGPAMSFNVAIRTAVIDIEEGLAEYGVGGGIVWDSVAEAEYEETRAKAQLLTDRRPDFDLFETIRWDDDWGFWWLDEHLNRMESSAEYFGFMFDREAVEEAAREAVRGQAGHLRVKVTASRRGQVTAAVTGEGLSPMAEGPLSGVGGIPVALAADPVNSQDVFLFHKTSQRDAYEARAPKDDTIEDVVLVNERGEVTESTIANLVVRFGDEWWTPTLDSGCLPGIYRGVLLHKGLIRERLIAVHELAAAEALALINSVQGWRSITLVDPD